MKGLGADVETGHCLVGDVDLDRVRVGVTIGGDGEAAFRGSGANQIDR